MTPKIVNPDWAAELEPDLTGPFGRAWRGVMPPELRDEPQHAASIDTWIMHVPGSHPFWTWYQMACVALRDLPGLPPAHRQFPEAAYELLVLSTNPEQAPPHPHRIGLDDSHWLSPPDHYLQFPALPGGDDKVREFVELYREGVDLLARAQEFGDAATVAQMRAHLAILRESLDRMETEAGRGASR